MGYITPSEGKYQMRLKALGGVAVFGACLALSGCGAKTQNADAGTSAEILATVGDDRITLDQVQRELEAQPDFVRARLSDPARRREYVEHLIRNRLLLGEARRLNLQDSPEVRAGLERLLIQQLLKQQTTGEPTEAEAQAWYDAHLTELSRPERVQVSLIEFGAATRADVEKEVARLRALKEPVRREAFLTLVQNRSTHEGSRSVQGDIGPRTREEITQLFGADASQAAFSLTDAGEISAPVMTAKGFVIFRLTARQPAQVPAFASEKARILARLSTEARSRKLEAITGALRDKAKVSINDTALEKLGGGVSSPLVP